MGTMSHALRCARDVPPNAEVVQTNLMSPYKRRTSRSRRRTRARKRERARRRGKLGPRDQEDLGQIARAGRRRGRRPPSGRDPALDIPARTLSNVRYNKTKRFIEMGAATNRRQLFNLTQAKSYMQTMLVASGATKLIDQGKTTSIRGLYYLLKHTIEGTKEETFDDQDECDPMIEDLEVALNAPPRGAARLREERGGDGRRDHAGRQRRRDRLLAHGLRRLQHPLDRRAGGDPVPQVRGQVHPARRKGHGLAAVQRGQVLAQAQLHPDPRRRPAAPRRAPAAAPPAQRAEAARLLPAGQRPLGILHLQRHQAGLDQPGLRVASGWPFPTPASSACAPATSSDAGCPTA